MLACMIPFPGFRCGCGCGCTVCAILPVATPMAALTAFDLMCAVSVAERLGCNATSSHACDARDGSPTLGAHANRGVHIVEPSAFGARSRLLVLSWLFATNVAEPRAGEAFEMADGTPAAPCPGKCAGGK